MLTWTPLESNPEVMTLPVKVLPTALPVFAHSLFLCSKMSDLDNKVKRRH